MTKIGDLPPFGEEPDFDNDDIMDFSFLPENGENNPPDKPEQAAELRVQIQTDKGNNFGMGVPLALPTEGNDYAQRERIAYLAAWLTRTAYSIMMMHRRP